MSKRKYFGVPTQEEIIQQYKEITELAKDIISFEQIKSLREKIDKITLMDIEINYNTLEKYNNEPIKVISYEYKNILIYANINANNKVNFFERITLYDDNGGQFADENYFEYEQEIERVAQMGILRLI